MQLGDRWLALFGVVALAAIGVWLGTQWHEFHAWHRAAPMATAGPSFKAEEVREFLAAAGSAETIEDPLQRCLAYPDPPGSHWSRDAVAAYCHSQLTTGISFDELKAQIEAGHADAIDRGMAELLQRQLAKPGSPGLFDATYEIDFDRSFPDIRPILDAWKRQSPQSAFAYAASGVAYTRAAWDARGATWAQDTPQSNLDSMGRLSAQAAADLDRAVALDNRVTIAYSTMIRLGGLNGASSDYASAAAKRGLAIDPSNYLIYSRLTWLAQPKWGGSIDAMHRVAADAQQHVRDNPMLVVIDEEPAAVESGFDDCGCNDYPLDASTIAGCSIRSPQKTGWVERV